MDLVGKVKVVDCRLGEPSNYDLKVFKKDNSFYISFYDKPSLFYNVLDFKIHRIFGRSILLVLDELPKNKINIELTQSVRLCDLQYFDLWEAVYNGKADK